MKIFIIIVCSLFASVSGYLFRMTYEDIIEEGLFLNIRNIKDILKFTPKYVLMHVPEHIYWGIVISFIPLTFAIIFLTIFTL